MNKTNIKTIYLARSLLLLLVTCSSEEPVNNGEGARLPLEIGASISEPVVSRALLGQSTMRSRRLQKMT